MSLPTPDRLAPQKLPGVIAGRYKPLRMLGSGGMGAVYEAEHTWTGRRVALKTLLPHLAGDEAAVARFRREARAGVQGAHPHIVEVLDMGVDANDGTVYLAQQLLEGEDLAACLAREGPLSLQRACEILVPVMAALDAAHRAGVVHRDVKPANVFLARNPSGVVPKVIDFGIAALADAAPVTQTGAPIGTPQYMAPEQARGARDLDARADVWAVGCLWFEALTGRRAFEQNGYQAVIARLLTGPAPSLRAAAPSLPPDLGDVVDGALQHDRTLRYRDMASFARALLSAPSIAANSWADTLAAAHPFPETLVRPAPEPAQGPTTLDLPPETPPVLPKPAAPTPATTAPSSVSPPAPPPASSWRTVAVAAMAAALVSTAVAFTRPTPVATPRPAVAPTSQTTAPPTATPVEVPPTEPPPSPAPQPAPPVVAATAQPTVLPATQRRARPRALSPATTHDASVRAPTVINGAPVLEP